ncbi:hypothetical protein TrCOL_g2716 [Triparma columacea]|uniref:Uncharacterized protein n=1 Tax=Triparma columacea TaxID=722753 RepID=A0A9W7GFM8_9STRA|nr:hypothetical protein TrCOL_g2716 [Triparma columacea]
MNYAIDRLDRSTLTKPSTTLEYLTLGMVKEAITHSRTIIQQYKAPSNDCSHNNDGITPIAMLFLDHIQSLEFGGNGLLALHLLSSVYDFTPTSLSGRNMIYDCLTNEPSRTREHDLIKSMVSSSVYSTPKPPGHPLPTPPVLAVLLHCKLYYIYTPPTSHHFAVETLRQLFIGIHWKVNIPTYDGWPGYGKWVRDEELKVIKERIGREARQKVGIVNDDDNNGDKNDDDDMGVVRWDVLPIFYQSLETKLRGRFKSHHAYYRLVFNLVMGKYKKGGISNIDTVADEDDEGRRRTRVYVIGDSHCVSLHMYRHEYMGDDGKVNLVEFLARPATGLKAGHVRKGTFKEGLGNTITQSFFTVSNLRAGLEEVKKAGTTEEGLVILTAGEIDCREGVGGVDCTRYIKGEVGVEVIEAWVQSKVLEFVEGVEEIREVMGEGWTIGLMPVCQAGNKEGGRKEGRELKRKTVGLWNEELRRVCRGGDGTVVFVDVEARINDEMGRVRKEVEGDGTHLGREVGGVVGEWVEGWMRRKDEERL